MQQRPHHVLLAEDDTALAGMLHDLPRKLGRKVVETVHGLGYRLGHP